MNNSPANLRSVLGLFPGKPAPRLYDRVVEALRTRHFSRRKGGRVHLESGAGARFVHLRAGVGTAPWPHRKCGRARKPKQEITTTTRQWRLHLRPTEASLMQVSLNNSFAAD